MIINFFLDNRIGGPHIYSNYIKKKFKKYKFFNITSGKSKISDYSLKNLKNKLKLLFPLEIIINILQIILIKKYFQKSKFFFVYTAYNIAPLIAGLILNKKIVWFILEKPNFPIFLIVNLFKNFSAIKIVCITKKIFKTLKIKKYKIFSPKIDTNFWKKSDSQKISKNKLIITCVGNINKTKNHLSLLNFLENY